MFCQLYPNISKFCKKDSIPVSIPVSTTLTEIAHAYKILELSSISDISGSDNGTDPDSRESLLKGKEFSTVDLLVLASLYKVLLKMQTFFTS